jgi:hypothetical protein
LPSSTDRFSYFASWIDHWLFHKMPWYRFYVGILSRNRLMKSLYVVSHIVLYIERSFVLKKY